MTPASARLALRCFGGLSIRVGEAAANDAPFLYRKSKALTAYLAVTGEVASRAVLATLLWSDMTESRGLANLRVVLNDLRKQLGPAVATVGDSVFLRDSYLESVDCRVLAEASGLLPSNGMAEGAAGELRAATEVYTGPFLEGFAVDRAVVFDEWVAAMRDHYHRRVLSTLHALASHYIADGAYAEAIDVSGRLVTLEPWQEPAARLLMEALDRAGNPVAALDAYARLRDSLTRELGALPQDETVQLAEHIASGTGRFARIERRPAVPAPAWRIVGRDEELALLEKELRRAAPNTRLITVTGPGGVGKTRLAHQVLVFLESSTSAGAAFVDLSSILDPAELPAAIAAALHRALGGAREPLDELCDDLADSDAILLLDNLEQLLPMAAPAVSRLLRHCPRVRILVTSRSPLGIPEERVVPIAPLPLPPVDTPEEQLASFGAVEMFVERAVAGGGSVASGEIPEVAELCRRLDGLPLSIELAASRLTHMSIAEMLARPWSTVGLDSPGRAGGPPGRQRSVADSIEWSYRMLAPSAQRLLRYLSVFPGGVPRDILVDMVLPGIANEADVQELVHTSLIERVQVPHAGPVRFRLLESTRAFAAQALGGEVHDAGSRLVAGYRELLAEADTGLRGDEQGTWLARLELETPNLRHALERAIAVDAAASLASVSAFAWYLNIRGAMREGIGWLDRIIGTLQGAAGGGYVPDPAIATAFGGALIRRALLAVRLGDDASIDRCADIDLLETAMSFLDAAPPTPSPSAAPPPAAPPPSAPSAPFAAPPPYAPSSEAEIEMIEADYVLAMLAQTLRTTSSEAIAETMKPLEGFVARLAYSHDVRAREQRGRLAIGLAGGYYLLADFGTALDWATAARGYFEEIGNVRGVAMALHQIGVAAGMAGRLELAESSLREAIAIAQQTGDVTFIGNGLYGLGAVMCMQFDADPTGPLEKVRTGARLLGAADRLSANTGRTLPEVFVGLIEHFTTGPRAALGVEEWARAKSEGWHAGFEVDLAPVP